MEVISKQKRKHKTNEEYLLLGIRFNIWTDYELRMRNLLTSQKMLVVN